MINQEMKKIIYKIKTLFLIMGKAKKALPFFVKKRKVNLVTLRMNLVREKN